jgi:hypothetical protein
MSVEGPPAECAAGQGLIGLIWVLGKARHTALQYMGSERILSDLSESAAVFPSAGREVIIPITCFPLR